MKNLKNLGEILNTKQQKLIHGGGGENTLTLDGSPNSTCGAIECLNDDQCHVAGCGACRPVSIAREVPRPYGSGNIVIIETVNRCG